MKKKKQKEREKKRGSKREKRGQEAGRRYLFACWWWACLWRIIVFFFFFVGLKENLQRMMMCVCNVFVREIEEGMCVCVRYQSNDLKYEMLVQWECCRGLMRHYLLESIWMTISTIEKQHWFLPIQKWHKNRKKTTAMKTTITEIKTKKQSQTSRPSLLSHLELDHRKRNTTTCNKIRHKKNKEIK